MKLFYNELQNFIFESSFLPDKFPPITEIVREIAYSLTEKELHHLLSVYNFPSKIENFVSYLQSNSPIFLLEKDVKRKFKVSLILDWNQKNSYYPNEIYFEKDLEALERFPGLYSKCFNVFFMNLLDDPNFWCVGYLPHTKKNLLIFPGQGNL